MGITEIWSLAFSALKERRLRTALTILMVIISATLLTSLNGMGAGFDNFIGEQLSQFAPNVLIVSTTSVVGGFGGGSQTPSSLAISDRTVKTIADIRGVDLVQPSYRGNVELIASGKSQTVQVTGIDHGNLLKVVPGLEVAEGDLVSRRDRVGVLLGHSVAYPPGESDKFTDVGRTIKAQISSVVDQGGSQKLVVETKSFIVRGILESSGNMIYDNSAFITLEAANALLDKAGKYDSMFVLTLSEEVNDSVEAEIQEKYGDNLSITSPKAIAETVRSVVSGVSMFIFGIATISMVVAAVGIITTLFTSVRERTREIGLFKALGFRNWQVLFMFLTESLTIGILGGTIGLLLGIVGAHAMSAAVRFGPNSPEIIPDFLPQDMAFVWALAVTLSLFAGLYPAWKASKLDPVVALRGE
ncbi:MAG: ABC transporter permease [Candidatus Bathyarchaeia archaeon]